MSASQKERRIRRLDDRLISQIAAGEVVERPASVVKELVENALDSGAGRVVIELEEGGRRRIVVDDDGHGMAPEELRAAFERHATSKISRFEDLERVQTLGFRGEALAAIAAVATVDATSAAEGFDASRVRFVAGRLEKQSPAPRGRGTRIEVDGLFDAVPARKSFLKKPVTEYRRAIEVVQGYALAHPEVHWTVHHDGRERLSAPATTAGGPDAPPFVEALRERVRQLFGSELADELVPLPPDAIVRGLLGTRRTLGGRRIFSYVNGRLLRDRSILGVFYGCVRSLWHGDRFPALFLFLDVPPHEVDVNVHPQKAEVRFRDRAVFGQLASVLRQALAQARDEEPTVLEEVDPQTRPSSFAWQGLGRMLEPGGGVVAEDSPTYPHPSQERIGGVSYQPWTSPGRGFSGAARPGDERPLRVLGQYKGSLVLVEGPDGLYLVDQHAAHERVLYERLRRALEGDEPEVQRLLEPLVLEFGPVESEALGEVEPSLARAGFELERYSGDAWAVRALPVGWSARAAERLLVAVAGESPLDGAGSVDVRARLLDGLAADRACQGAIKIHHPLSLEKMEQLVGELFEAEQPYACPHGRPTILKLDDSQLERRFGRQGWSQGGEPAHF